MRLRKKVLSQAGAFIQAYIDERGISRATLAREVGTDRQSLENFMYGATGRPRFLIELAQRLGVDVLALVNPRLAPKPKPLSGSLTVQTSGAVVHVPMLSAHVSAGPGSETVEEDVVVTELSLSKEWVTKTFGETCEGLRFLHATGDSMKPTFSSGDILLVDTDVRDVQNDGIYVLYVHQRLFVKRVRQRMNGDYEISSDNSTVKTVDVLNGGHEVECRGRVLFAWNGIRL